MPASMIRTFHHADRTPDALAERKDGRRVSVCLPARDEAATVGAIVSAIRGDLVDGAGLVDELVVIDDHSTDGTGRVARGAGADVVAAADILPELGLGPGKGQALWKSLHVTRGDLVVWCDADIRDFDVRFVTGLLAPLLDHDDICLVKGFYERPADGPASGGGRVTELVARPLISMLFPHLAPIVQPLAGEYAGRREALEAVPFVGGYGVELGLLIDVAERFGASAIAQADLGERVHRNRPLDELAPQAAAVLHTALRRAGLDADGSTAQLVRPGLDPVPVDPGEMPPMRNIATPRRHTA